MIDLWDEEPEMPNSRDMKYSQSEVDWRISESPVDFFKSVEYMRDLVAWKEKHDAWLEKIKVEHDLLREHSGRWLHFVAVDYPEIKESLSPKKLMELKEKAEKYDAHEWITKETPDGVTLEIYHIDDLATAHDDKRKAELKLEDVTNWFNDWINPWLDKAGEEGFMLPKKRMTSLKKILEDHSSGETPT